MMWYMDIIQCGLIENVQNDHKMANTFCQTDLKVINLLWPMPHHVSMPHHVPHSWNLIFRLEAQSARFYLKLSQNWKYEIAPQNSFRWSKNKLKTSLPTLTSATACSFLSWCGRSFGGKNYQKDYLLDCGPDTLQDFDQTAKIRKLNKLIIQTEDLTSTAVCSFQVSETIIFVKECWCWTTLAGNYHQKNIAEQKLCSVNMGK